MLTPGALKPEATCQGTTALQSCQQQEEDGADGWDHIRNRILSIRLCNPEVPAPFPSAAQLCTWKLPNPHGAPARIRAANIPKKQLLSIWGAQITPTHHRGDATGHPPPTRVPVQGPLPIFPLR